VVTAQVQVKLMQSPERWPLRPRLPLKRPWDRAPAELGVLIERGETVEPVVYICNMLIGITRDTEVLEFSDFEAIHDTGWVID
jgi:hypothetical protein